MTDNATTTVEQTPKPAAPATTEVLSVEAPADTLELRAAKLIEKLNSERGSDEEPADAAQAAEAPAEEPEKPAKPAKRDESTAEAKPAPEDDERKKRIDRAREIEREQVLRNSKAKERERALEAKERELQAAQERIAARERMFEDPAQLLEQLSERVPPQQLADWLLQSKDPHKAAEWAAKRAAREAAARGNPEAEALKAEMAAIRDEIRATRAQEVQARAEAQFIGIANELSENAPHVAAMAKARPQHLLQSANSVSDFLAANEPEWGEMAPSTRMKKIVEFIENDLSSFTGIFAPSKPAGEQQTTSKPSQDATASKARTLSGRTSAGRSQLVDEDEIAKLSLDERAAHLTRLARQHR